RHPVPSRESVGAHAPDPAVRLGEHVPDPRPARAGCRRVGFEPAPAVPGDLAVAEAEPEAVLWIGVEYHRARKRRFRHALSFLEIAHADETLARPHHDRPHVARLVLCEVHDRAERPTVPGLHGVEPVLLSDEKAGIHAHPEPALAILEQGRDVTA